MAIRYLLPAMLLLALPTAAAHAQGKFEGGPTKGARTTSVSGSVTYSAQNNYNATVRVDLGYYASSSLEYGGVIAINGQSSPAVSRPVTGGGTATISSSSSSGLALGAIIRYHFGHTKIIPYVGFAPQYDVLNITGSRSQQLILVGTAGADFFIKPQESIFAELSLEQFTKDSTTTGRLEVGLKLFY